MTQTFGALLRHLRRRQSMTQSELAHKIGYSRSLIAALEGNRRLPDVEEVIQSYLPALGLLESPVLGKQLVELAVASRRGASGALPSVGPHRREVTFEGSRHPRHIPALVTPLVGREREVAQLCERLLEKNARLLTLVGPPGVGKTSMAQVVGAQVQGFFDDGALFVPLAAVTEPELVVPTLCEALGIASGSSSPPMARLLGYLRRKHILLVLDNCEQIVACAPLLAEILIECAGVQILATSRERLHLRAEQRYRVPPLDLASAVALFCQRAEAVDSDFNLSVERRPMVEKICQRLDGLPLAIELCAAQCDYLTLSQLLERFEQRPLNLLVDGAVDLPPRQRTLRQAILASYELLSLQEQTLFRCVGVFTGGFALPELMAMLMTGEPGDGLPDDAITALAEPVVLHNTLHALVAKSMVRAERSPDDEKRYMLLETLREYALEEMHSAEEETLWRRRHYATYFDLLLATDRHLREEDAEEWLTRVQPETDNIRSAFEWAMASARYTEAAELGILATYFMAMSGHGREDAARIARLLPHRQVLENTLRIALLLTYCRAAAALAGFPSIVPYMDEALALLEECPIRHLHAVAWNFRAWTTDDDALAEDYLVKSIELAHVAESTPTLGDLLGAIGDRSFCLAVHLWGYASFLTDQGQAERARAPVVEALSLFEERGNRTGIRECLGVLGRLALMEGDLAQAQGLFQEAASLTSTLEYGTTRHDWQAYLGLVCFHLGDTTEARQLLATSLRRQSEQKNAVVLVQIHTFLAEVALSEGDYDGAGQHLRESFAYERGVGRVTISLFERYILAARLATAVEDLRRAALLFGFSAAVQRRLGCALPAATRTPYGRALEVVQGGLETDVFASAFAEGEKMSPAEMRARLLHVHR